MDVPYGTGSGRDLLLDIYSPDAATSQRTAVLQFHGGGWRGGSRKNLAPHAKLLQAAGFTAIPAEYRLTGEAAWPAQVHDVKAAVRWARAHAAELGVEPGRIALEGFSAGAHLSLLAAGTAGLAAFEGEGGNPGVATEVAAVIAFYPPTVFHAGDVRERGSLAATALLGENASLDDARLISPLTHVTAAFPPTLFLHGGADQVVPTSASVVMYDAVRATGVPADLHIFSGQNHGFDHVDVYRDVVAREVAFFLERTVSRKAEIEAKVLEQSMFARRQAEAVAGGGRR